MSSFYGGRRGPQGPKGDPGKDGKDGKDGAQGPQGKSYLDIAAVQNQILSLNSANEIPKEIPSTWNIGEEHLSIANNAFKFITDYNTFCKIMDGNAGDNSEHQRDLILEFGTASNPKAVRPYATNVTTLGTSNYRWKEIWCNQSSINQSSDKKLKKDINYNISDNMIDLFDNLKICSFKWKNNTSNRTHYGIIAQDLKENIENHNLTTTEYGAIVIDKILNQDSSPRKWYDVYCGYENTYMTENGEKNPNHIFNKREKLNINTYMNEGVSIFTKPQSILTLKTLSHPEDFENNQIPAITIHSIVLKSSNKNVQDKIVDLSNNIITCDWLAIPPIWSYNEDNSVTFTFSNFGNAIGIWINKDGSAEELDMYDTIELDVTYSDQFAIGANDDLENPYKEMSEEERTIYAVRWDEIVPLNVKRTQMLVEENKQLKQEIKDLKDEFNQLKTEIQNLKNN